MTGAPIPAATAGNDVPKTIPLDVACFFHLETILLLRNNTTAHSVLLILFLLASIPYFVYQIFYVACCQISSNYCPHPECLFLGIMMACYAAAAAIW